MKSAAALLFLLASTLAHATSYYPKTEDLSVPNYEITITYPVIAAGAIPAAATVTSLIRNDLLSYGCDPSGATAGQLYTLTAQARVVGFNPNYVGVEANVDYDCGGAYPTSETINLTYDSQTGQPVDFDHEVPLQNYKTNEDLRLKFQTALAEIIYAHVKTGEAPDSAGCLTGMTQVEATQEIASFSPQVVGLAANKTVVLRTQPAHAYAVCTLTATVSYAEVSRYIVAGSKLHGWLR